jgi:hypothetical protein
LLQAYWIWRKERPYLTAASFFFTQPIPLPLLCVPPA